MSSSPETPLPSPFLRASRVLREIRNGQLATLYKINLGDPRVIQIAAAAGASALWLCNEHVPNDWANLENQIRAAALHDTDVLVRVSKGSYSDYIRPLEAGAAGIIVPHVRSADEARQIVEWTRFGPLGKRPLDGGNADGGYGQVSTADYIAFSNAERILILQIESPEAVDNVEEIASVPGFDFLMFGPGDYSHLIGLPGQVRASEVEAARNRVEQAALQNKKWGVAVAVPGSADELLARGYRLVHTGADVIGLSQAVTAALAPFATHAARKSDSLYGR